MRKQMTRQGKRKEKSREGEGLRGGVRTRETLEETTEENKRKSAEERKASKVKHGERKRTKRRKGPSHNAALSVCPRPP